MDPLAELIGDSPAIEAVRHTIRRLLGRHSDARRLPPILIQGETGTGKGLLARVLHAAGPRRSGPLIDVNCAAIPESLLEAELFGFERGAFTDARQAKLGLFQAAHHGTIFLDEIGLLPVGVQGKLLSALEERAVRRLGSIRSEPVDVWILAASNEDLAAASRERRFRQDLYHRLAVVTLWLPPLRERGEDVLRLAEHFLAQACVDYGLPAKTLAPAARACLLAHGWPGNVRELANVMERVALLAELRLVTADMLGLPALAAAAVELGKPDPNVLAVKPAVRRLERERDELLEALQQTNWNISRAAARLGLPRNTVRYRIEKHDLHAGASAAGARQPRTKLTTAGRQSLAFPTPPAVSAPAAARWTRRHVALLRASLALEPGTERLPDASRVIGGFVDKVQSFGGRIEDMGPRGLVAVFGLEPVEDAPSRAAHCAIAMRKAAERTQAGHRERIPTSISIHVTELLVGEAGSAVAIDPEAKRQEWQALDELVAGAAPDSIIVSAATAAFLERRFELELVGTRESGRMPAYQVRGLERTGYGLGGRPLSRFVGRARELDILRDLSTQAQRGHGQVVAMVGEPGVGKSRLLYEFTPSLRSQGWRVLECSAVSYGAATPYQAIVDLLTRDFRIEDRDDELAIRKKVSAKLRTLDTSLESALPPLLALLHVPVEDAGWQALDPPQRRQQTFDAVKRLVVRESQVQPLCCLVEDLHWIDRETHALLDSLIEGVPTVQLLLLVSYRPEFGHGWGSKTFYTQLRLDPLPPENAQELLETLLGQDGGLEPLKRLLIERTEGNPFFLEEIVRTLLETHVLVGSPRDYHLGKPLETTLVPATIEAVVAARLERLPPKEKELLQSAAVIGKDLPWVLLQRIADMPEAELRQSLADLQRAELLYERSLLPELEYTFKHALTHEVAYGSLLQEQRRTLHARIVEAIEALYSDRLSAHIERLAHHAVRGELWEKAVTYLRQAGTRAVARSAYHEAVAAFEQALAALRHLPESRVTVEQAIDLRLSLRTPLRPLGELHKVLEYLREAERLAQTLDDPRRLGWVSAWMTQAFWVTGHSTEARTFGQQARVIAEALQEVPLTVVANLVLGLACITSGDFPRAEDCFLNMRRLLEDDLSRERFGTTGFPAVQCRAWLAWSLAERGAFQEGIAHGQHGLRLGEAVNDPYSLIIACLGLGVLYGIRGELGHAVPLLERGATLARDRKVTLLAPRVMGILGYAYALSGRVAEGLALLDEALKVIESMEQGAFHALLVMQHGEACGLADRRREARAFAEQALTLARTRGQRSYEAYALRLLGEIASHRDSLNVEQSEKHYGQALVLASELGMRPLIAHCQLGLGKLYRRAGEHEKSREHFTTASTMYREMDMQFWLRQVEPAETE